nr:MAG TPA: hypothetical protein [Microviridae sp.]
MATARSVVIHLLDFGTLGLKSEPLGYSIAFLGA